MLKEKFLQLISKYSNNDDYNLTCWNEIEKHYSSKSRYYHNLDHIKNMLLDLVHIESEINDIDTLLFSIYYHDIVYQSMRSDNEHKSALFLQKELSNTNFTKIQQCILQIELTKEHKLSTDNDTNFLLDLDLSILGKSQEVYHKYVKNIRKEYSIFPDFIYNKGRVKVLNKLLAQDQIFKTTFFNQKYERQARENLFSEMNELNRF